MALSYYLFGLFIFVLICAVLFLCKFLFSGVKAQNHLLDEKEKKLLRLYQSVEEVMDEFYASVAESKSEFQSSVRLASEKIKQTSEQAAEYERQVSAKKPTISYLVDDDTPEQELSFGQVLNNTVQMDPGDALPPRSKNILNLHNEGMTRIEIAKDLGITLAEVDLVIGIAKKTGPDSH